MATISSCCSGDPEIGPRLDNGKWRVVVGWNYQNDTAAGIQTGKVWGWVSAQPEKFQVYDESFNRSPIAGVVRFCGVANFTMVRMFHPYWAHFDKVPRDGNLKDKNRCRHKYHLLIRKHRLFLGLPVDEDPAEYAARIAFERNEQREIRGRLADAKIEHDRKIREEREAAREEQQAAEDEQQVAQGEQEMVPEERKPELSDASLNTAAVVRLNSIFVSDSEEDNVAIKQENVSDSEHDSDLTIIFNDRSKSYTYGATPTGPTLKTRARSADAMTFH